jgi:chromosome segregation ATPase
LPNVALKQPIVRQPLPSSSSSTPVVQSAAPVSTIIPTRTVPTPDTKQMAKELEFMQNILDKERESARKFKADFESQQSELEKVRREFKIYEVENRDLKVQLEKVNIKLEAASVSADEISQQHSLAIDEQGLREQETLLKAYELENERMTRHIKELEHKLKNGSVEFDEERQRLHNEISLLNTRLSEKEGSDPRERRREEDKQKQVEAIRVQFQSVEADLRAQIDQLQVNMGQKANEEKVKLEKEYQLKLLNAQQKEKQLSKELKEKDGEIRELKSQILKKNAAATAKESKLKQPATSSMKSLSNLSDLKRVRQLEADLFDMQAKCREFEAQLAGQNKAFSEQLAVVEKEKVWLQDEAAARLSELRDEHLRVLQTLKEKNRAVEGAQSEIVKLKQSIADDPSGSGHLVHLESKLSQTEQDLKSAKQRLERLENVESAMETVKGVAETLRGELNVRQREVEKMKGELFGTQQELAVAQKELAKKHAIIEHNLQQMSDLSSKTHASILHKSGKSLLK